MNSWQRGLGKDEFVLNSKQIMDCQGFVLYKYVIVKEGMVWKI